MTFVTGADKLILKNMETKNLSYEEVELLKVISKIQRRAEEIMNPIIDDMEKNKLPEGDTGVHLINNAWVVTPHHYTPQKISLEID